MKKISRRDFLRLATHSLLAVSGALGIAGLFRYLSYQFDPLPPSEFDLGPADNYRLNSHTVIAHIPALVIHKKDGFHALSLVCSHLGCTIEQRNFGFECPCHSSRYDKEGVVLKGPATANLRKLRVEETPDGNLHVFTR